MGRMGHSTTRAALIYRHRTTERDRLIAVTMSATVALPLSCCFAVVADSLFVPN